MNADVDVIVIGGGVSGMAAAKVIHDAGRSVLVVEANDRFGGRSWSEQTSAGLIEHGGMYIGEHDRHLIALGESLGMHRTAASLDGEDVFLIEGARVVAVNGDLPEDNPHGAEFAKTVAAIQELADEVGYEAPWEHPRAAELDSRTVKDWLDSITDDTVAVTMHSTIFGPLLGADASDISLLFWAYYVAECGGIGDLIATSGGAQNEWWLEGASTVSSRIGELLGDAARLNWPVDRIAYDDEFVTVWNGSESVTAREAIIAVPPASANRISFSPPLGAVRDQLQMRAPLGRIVKVVARYDRPFWTSMGLSGSVVNYGDLAFYQLDGTKSTETEGTVIGFVGGSSYEKWRSLERDAQRRTYLGLVAEALGEEALTPIYYDTTDWAQERWNRGAPVTYLPPGILSAYGPALRSSGVPNLHIAGTEAAMMHAGYMEGGVRAGQTAAADALKRLLAND